MYCPNCGVRNDDGNSFCAKCGSKLSQQNEIFCWKCGAKSSPSNIHCPSCGAVLNSPSSQPSVVSSPITRPVSTAATTVPAGRMSKGLFAGTWAVALGIDLIASTVNSILTMALRQSLDANGVPYTFAVGFSPILTVLYWITGIAMPIVMFVFWYKAWQAIQDGHARMTAGKAVWGFLIPFYNIYHGFQVTFGFVTDFNAYVDRHRLNTSKLTSGTFIALYVCGALAFIGMMIHPLLGWLLCYVPYVLYIVMVSRISDRVNAIHPASAGTLVQ